MKDGAYHIQNNSILWFHSAAIGIIPARCQQLNSEILTEISELHKFTTTIQSYCCDIVDTSVRRGSFCRFNEGEKMWQNVIVFCFHWKDCSILCEPTLEDTVVFVAMPIRWEGTSNISTNLLNGMLRFTMMLPMHLVAIRKTTTTTNQNRLFGQKRKMFFFVFSATAYRLFFNENNQKS